MWRIRGGLLKDGEAEKLVGSFKDESSEQTICQSKFKSLEWLANSPVSSINPTCFFHSFSQSSFSQLQLLLIIPIKPFINHFHSQQL
jgi:hypothetical protein